MHRHTRAHASTLEHKQAHTITALKLPSEALKVHRGPGSCLLAQQEPCFESQKRIRAEGREYAAEPRRPEFSSP